jgi:hypothetical protein
MGSTMPPRDRPQIRAVALPLGSLVADAFPRQDFADAYEMTLPAGADDDPMRWAQSMFAAPPRWISAAMRLRNALVARFGLQRPPRPATGFPLLASTDREVLLGLDDAHLDFRASILTRQRNGRPVVTVSTVVRLHNRLGRAYFGIVRPVHPLIVRAIMRRAEPPDRPTCPSCRERGRRR